MEQEIEDYDMDVDDLVEINGRVEKITGIIKEERKVFTTSLGGWQEAEFKFSDVTSFWKKNGSSHNSSSDEYSRKRITITVPKEE